MLTDPDLVGCYVALTPTWNETSYFADYVLPMGHGSERHDIHSYETHDAQWLGFRQPVMKAARQREGEDDQRHARSKSRRGLGRERVLDGTHLAHRSGRQARHSPVCRVEKESGRRVSASMNTTNGSSTIRFPGCRRRRRRKDLTPLEFMRRYGAFEIKQQGRSDI